MLKKIGAGASLESAFPKSGKCARRNSASVLEATNNTQ